jgi:hypothetical protein
MDNLTFIHCYNEESFNELIKKGFTPLKNDNPYVLLNNENTSFEDFTIFGNTIEFSDIMLF